MADLDDVVQKVLLEGDNEIISGLNEIGRAGEEAFRRLEEASKSGGGGFETFAIAAVAVETAVSAIAAAVVSFTASQDELIQKTAFLASAFGATTQELVGIEAGFAAAGVSANNFERFAQRLTTTIAQQWPQITANVRTAATQQSEAQEQIISATLRVKSAQDAVAFGAEETNNRIEAALLHAREAYIALQFAASEAASTQVHDLQSVESANLSLEGAEQKLRTLQGNPPSAAEKEGLALREASLAVDRARQATVDALNKQLRDQAEAADKLEQKRQAASAAALTASKDIAQAEVAQLQRTNALAEAQDRKAAAQEKADKLALASIPAITNALQGVIEKNDGVAKSVDLSQVSVRNLTNGVINLASQANNGLKPTGLQVYTELVKVLSTATDDQITKDQRLTIVQELLSRGFQQGGATASELLAAMERGTKGFSDYTSAANKHVSASKEGAKAAEDFKSAMESFNLELSLTQRDLATFASPAVIAFLDTIRTSLTEDGGLLHSFVTGLQAVGSAISALVEGAVKLGETIDDALSEKHGTTMKVLLITLTTLVGLFITPWIGIPILIGLVVTAMGALSELTTKAKNVAIEAWHAFQDTSVYKFIEGVISLVQKLIDLFAKIPKWFSGGSNASAAGANANGNSNEVVPPISRAGGGEIDGPGSTTSDSIFARLSRGEFVQRAAAVQHYGVDFMHAINNLSFPGFAMGGLVPAPARVGNPASMPATSTLNLSIDGRSFNGLRGPKSTIDDLSSFAIARQTSSAGSRPSWMK